MPNAMLETVAAVFPPIFLSRITGGQSPTTGQRIEGFLFSLGATPRQMLQHSENFIYSYLTQVARMAERRGARILGLGAFTSVVGDAGVTLARRAAIPITTGNSLTVQAVIETSRRALEKMGAPALPEARVMVIGASGSIGSACSRLLAQSTRNLALVALEPEQLAHLKSRTLAENPGCKIVVDTHSNARIAECDLIITTTSAFSQRVLDIARCRPGAVICDVARPHNISPEEAAERLDVLVVESGEVLIPGEIDFGYNIGLPPGLAYACLAETALLALEGRFEDYTLGRDISLHRVEEITGLFEKHQFQWAGLHSFGRALTDEMIAQKRQLADDLRKRT